MQGKELGQIILALIVSAFAVSFKYLSLETFLLALLFFAVIFAFNVGAKKLYAYSLQSDAEIKIWHFQRWGWYERSHFPIPIPIGIILPFLLSILSLGYVPWLATTQTEIQASRAKVAKRHGIYRYSEMTESGTGWIAAYGIIAVLFLALVSYFINLPILSKYAILFCFFNIIPLGHLDGTKILFGNKVLWAVLAVLCLTGLGYILFLP